MKTQKIHKINIGSPPHTWRIQPFKLLSIKRAKDHLHIRGEYSFLTSQNWWGAGSPPHTWRILLLSSTYLIFVRITSTYVENTFPDDWKFYEAEDHLHIRGEYPLWDGSLVLTIGSPPHTWRILSFRRSIAFCLGITSTYVENTLHTSLIQLADQDHLHIRGEYRLIRGITEKSKGSPPHTWRILHVFADYTSRRRITSTYVENTHNHHLYSCLVWDHLHIRGEYVKT